MCQQNTVSPTGRTAAGPACFVLVTQHRAACYAMYEVLLVEERTTTAIATQPAGCETPAWEEQRGPVASMNDDGKFTMHEREC